MMQTVLWTTIQLVLLVVLAPLLQGLIKKTKARLQNRIGPPLLQSYYDIGKALQKDAVISEHASWLTRTTPYIVWATILTAGLLAPMFAVETPLGFAGDVLMLVYLFGLARFFTALAGLDSGSATQRPSTCLSFNRDSPSASSRLSPLPLSDQVSLRPSACQRRRSASPGRRGVSADSSKRSPSTQTS